MKKNYFTHRLWVAFLMGFIAFIAIPALLDLLNQFVNNGAIRLERFNRAFSLGVRL
jgi:hypothetical protein